MPLAARLEDLDYGYTEGICKAARAYPLQGIKICYPHRNQTAAA